MLSKYHLLYRIYQNFINLFLVALLVSCSNLTTEKGSFPSQVDKVMVDNNKAKLHLENAITALEQNDTAAASLAFEAMNKAGAKSPEALNHYAIFLREQWLINESEAIYRKALIHSPNNAMTHYNLGILLDLYQGRRQEALEHYQKYQVLAETPDKRVAGWIKDIQRQIDNQIATQIERQANKNSQKEAE